MVKLKVPGELTLINELRVPVDKFYSFDLQTDSVTNIFLIKNAFLTFTWRLFTFDDQ